MSYIHDTCAAYVVVHATCAGSVVVDAFDAWAGSVVGVDVDADACPRSVVVVKFDSYAVVVYGASVAGPGSFVNCFWWKNYSLLIPK